ncbi:hypothetical protein MTR_8g101500 [Medicago truncatula]|uniref:Uncharacterized protein n=1 Tax=Medicago truncatula TaxID=3880 RepID=G7LIX2_MEDTR|nr:hypothetical protein MTR_8g101500 [Medicago truncatula]
MGPTQINLSFLNLWKPNDGRTTFQETFHPISFHPSTFSGNKQGTNPTAHLRGPRFKTEQALYGLSPPKLALEGIESETSGGANSKIPSQPLGQPQMGYDQSTLKLVYHFKTLKVYFTIRY